MTTADQTEFQRYVLTRLTEIFPTWSEFITEYREDWGVETVYKVPSPANPENNLYISIRPDEIMVKFAVQGSHEHYDLDYGVGDTDEERYEDTLNDAMSEYITPVLENRLVAVWFGDHRGNLVSDADDFVQLNNITNYRTETWDG